MTKKFWILMLVLSLLLTGCAAANVERTLDAAEEKVEEKLEAAEDRVEDALRADAIFTVLMGEQVDPRKEWIERNAKYAINIDF